MINSWKTKNYNKNLAMASFFDTEIYFQKINYNITVLIKSVLFNSPNEKDISKVIENDIDKEEDNTKHIFNGNLSNQIFNLSGDWIRENESNLTGMRYFDLSYLKNGMNMNMFLKHFFDYFGC